MVNLSASTSGSGNRSAVGSYNAIVAGDVDKEKGVLLQNKKEAGLTYLTCKILKEEQQQKLAAIHYTAVNNYFIFAPTMFITFTSVFLSLLIASSLIFSDNTRTLIAISITVLQLLLSALQSVAKQLDLGGKARIHQTTSISLRKIYDYACYSMKEAKYESMYKASKTNNTRPTGTIGLNLADDLGTAAKEEAQFKMIEKSEEKKDDDNADAEADAEADKEKEKEKPHSVESLTHQFHQVVDQVGSPVPIELSAAFDLLESRINILNKSLVKNKKSLAWEKVFPGAYHQLSDTIIQSRGWPVVIPDPEWSVEKALKDFKHFLKVNEDNNADLLKDLVVRLRDLMGQAAAISNVGDQLRNEFSPILAMTGGYDDGDDDGFDYSSTKPMSTTV